VGASRRIASAYRGCYPATARPPALFAFSDTNRSDLEQVRHNLKRIPSKSKIFLSFPRATVSSCSTIKLG
jgi:hypothetical protein